MAQGNLILGTMKGKLGDVVAYNYNGKQAARVRRRNVGNPRSSKQAIQRAIAATVAQYVSAFAPVLNNSLQSEQTKVKTLAKIRSLNMTMLRQLAAQNLGFYNRKGSVYVSPNDYVISRGDLQGINPLRSERARLQLDSGYLCVPTSEISTVNSSFTASQAFPSVAVGDQITILATYTADFSKTNTIVRYCRFAFKDDATPVFLEQGDTIRLNPAAIDLAKAEGDWRLLTFADDNIEGTFVTCIDLSDFIGVDRADMAGIIVSREAGKKRSSAYMVSAIFDDDPDFFIGGVYPTYMDGGTTIDMPSDLYLNNDSQSASTVAPEARYKGFATGSSPELPFTFADQTGRLIVTTSKNEVPSETQSIGTIKCTLGGVEYETTIEVDNSGSSLEAHADFEGAGRILFAGLNAQGQYLSCTINSADLAGLTVQSINLNW